MVALLPMNERYVKWYTPWLSREFEMLVFGDKRSAHRVAVCGASLGAYHAANIAFRHPERSRGIP